MPTSIGRGASSLLLIDLTCSYMAHLYPRHVGSSELTPTITRGSELDMKHQVRPPLGGEGGWQPSSSANDVTRSHDIA